MKKSGLFVLGLLLSLVMTSCTLTISMDKGKQDNIGSESTAEEQTSTMQENTPDAKMEDREDAPAAHPHMVQGNGEEPFWGIWCYGSKSRTEADNFADVLSSKGYNAQVFVTTDWSNLNSEIYYVVTAGIFNSETDAKDVLPTVISDGYKDAYVKYTGQRKSSLSIDRGNGEEPFWGIWCYGSKSRTEADNFADVLSSKGYNAQVFVTTDWSNLNSEKYYVVTAGVYYSETDAKKELASVKSLGYSDAYVKYSGNKR